MSEERVGAVRFKGDPNTNCVEAQEYREDGSAALNPGDVLEGIPESELVRFLLNADFEPADSVAEEVYASDIKKPADRINGAYIRELKPDEVEGFEEGGADVMPLRRQNKSQLLDSAATAGIGDQVDSDMTKAEIIEKIEEAQAKADEPPDPLADTTESTVPPPGDGQGSDGGES